MRLINLTLALLPGACAMGLAHAQEHLIPQAIVNIHVRDTNATPLESVLVHVYGVGTPFPSTQNG